MRTTIRNIRDDLFRITITLKSLSYRTILKVLKVISMWNALLLVLLSTEIMLVNFLYSMFVGKLYFLFANYPRSSNWCWLVIEVYQYFLQRTWKKPLQPQYYIIFDYLNNTLNFHLLVNNLQFTYESLTLKWLFDDFFRELLSRFVDLVHM